MSILDYLISPILLIDKDIKWDYQVDISFESKSRGMSWDYQVGLTFRSKAKVSGGPIRWNHYFEAMAEESGTTIRLSYNLEVKAEVSPGGYQVVLSFEIKGLVGLSSWITHPSAENLITLGCEHHDGTTCHMSLWQKVSVSGKTESP